MIKLLSRIVDIMDSPHRDEFIKRYRGYIKNSRNYNKLKMAFEKSKVLNSDEQFSEEKMKVTGFVHKKIQIEDTEKQMFLGPLSFKRQHTIDVRAEFDYIDELIYDIDHFCISHNCDDMFPTILTMLEGPKGILKHSASSIFDIVENHFKKNGTENEKMLVSLLKF